MIYDLQKIPFPFQFKYHKKTVPIYWIPLANIRDWIKDQDIKTQNLVKESLQHRSTRKTVQVFSDKGKLEKVIHIPSSTFEFWEGAHLAEKIIPTRYKLCFPFPEKKPDIGSIIISWGLSQYNFSFRATLPLLSPTGKILCLPEKTPACQEAFHIYQAIALTRNLINMPSNYLSPKTFEDLSKEMAQDLGMHHHIFAGDILEKEFPLIHAVGKGGSVPPRLIEMTWGNPKHPRLALIGKGVCFDTGGVNLKPAFAMRDMKKDMGGAAHVLALAELIVRERLPFCLHILLPCVENTAAPHAMRPGDVFLSRKGLSVEIGHTDAEGRLILADALTYACENQPHIVIDFATLTGAARVALGPSLPALFTNRKLIQNAIARISSEIQDTAWPLPLWPGYERYIQSSIADIQNDTGSFVQAGAITAALFLQKFIPPSINWVHLDIMGWNPCATPGRPYGGEAMGLRAIFEYLKKRSPYTSGKKD